MRLYCILVKFRKLHNLMKKVACPYAIDLLFLTHLFDHTLVHDHWNGSLLNILYTLKYHFRNKFLHTRPLNRCSMHPHNIFYHSCINLFQILVYFLGLYLLTSYHIQIHRHNSMHQFPYCKVYHHLVYRSCNNLLHTLD